MTERFDIPELAALYAAGALPPGESAAFEQMCDQDPAAAAALRGLAPAIESLARSLPPAAPPPALKARLLQRLTDQAAVEPSLTVRRAAASDDDWQDIGIPGARMRLLYVDSERHVQTFLIRLEPGCRVPAHPHPGVEECYIVEGDLHTYNTVLRAGDYMRAAAGTEHAESYTENGCLMLVTAALDAA